MRSRTSSSRPLAEMVARTGLSNSAAAREVGIHPRTMRKYLSGDLPVPKWLPLALQALKTERTAMQTKVTLTDRSGHHLKSIFLQQDSRLQERIGRAKEELMSINPDGYVFVTHVGNGEVNQ